MVVHVTLRNWVEGGGRVLARMPDVGSTSVAPEISISLTDFDLFTSGRLEAIVASEAAKRGHII